MSTVHLHILPPRVETTKVFHEAILRDEGAGGSSRPAPTEERFWFAIPHEQAEMLTNSAEPFVRALVFAFMHRARPVRVHGHVSPSLLRNLEEFMHIWHAWEPKKYTPVSIRADDESPQPTPPHNAPAISAFSGGLDSSYTIWRHTQGLIENRRVNLQAAMFGSGLDHSHAHRDAFEASQESMLKMLASVNVRMLTIETNFREIHMNPWDAFGAVLAGCLSLFAKAYPIALLPASAGYANLVVPHATSPVTDHLFNGDAFCARHDGAELLRPEKVGIVADWPQACEHLRVCWEGPEPYRNCGVCDKCVRTIMGFWLHGRPTPKSFAIEPDAQTISRVELRSRVAMVGFDNLISRAQARGISNAWWVAAARSAVRRNRRRWIAQGLRRQLRAARARLGLYQMPPEPTFAPSGP